MAAATNSTTASARGFSDRLRANGYSASAAAENISAGYHTLAEAFSGWRDSPPHRKNMLLNGATRIGIAAVQAPKSKFKVYWALISRRPTAGAADRATAARPALTATFRAYQAQKSGPNRACASSSKGFTAAANACVIGSGQFGHLAALRDDRPRASSSSWTCRSRWNATAASTASRIARCRSAGQASNASRCRKIGREM